MSDNMENKGVQIIAPSKDNVINLDVKALDTVLMQAYIKDRYISIVSVTGVFRQGKSFLLNFLIRYLDSKYVKRENVTEWLKPEDGPLQGFAWSAGSNRHTSGILMWREVFIGDLPNGEQVAIILLDTQGSFDHGSSLSDSATIFSLSTLISSVQIYNVTRNIRQYDLTHLQWFGGYGQLLSKANGTKPFQNLIFLVRDWSCPYEKPYGADGGAALLDQVFNNENNSAEVKAQVNTIRELFNDISCFLLPYPGTVVDSSPNFNGNLEDIGDEFKKHIQEFVPLFLSPENIVLKTIHGQRIKAGELAFYIKEYTKILKNNEMPQINILYKASIKAHCKVALDKAFKLYKKLMDSDCEMHPTYYQCAELYERHNVNKTKAIKYYEKGLNLEDPELSDKYLILLKNRMDDEYKNVYVEMNDKKKNEIIERQRKKRKEEAEQLKRQFDSLQLGTSRRSNRSDQAFGDLLNAENIGTAVAVVGTAAALAFGASKFFGGTNNKD